MGKIGKRKYIRQRIRKAKGKLNPFYLASCYSKACYDKKQAAEMAQKLGIKSYKCRFCKHYHIGRKQNV